MERVFTHNEEMDFITNVEVDDMPYKIYNIDVTTIEDNEPYYVSVAEECLENVIQKFIRQDRYLEVQHIDEMFAFIIPQEIIVASGEDKGILTDYVRQEFFEQGLQYKNHYKLNN